MRLIDADALVVDLEKRYTYEMADGRNKAYGKGVRDAIKDIWGAPTVGAWVSVKDGMPEEHKLVLATDETFYVHVNWIVESKWIRPFHNRITYWMTIPNLPKEG